eukprot:tig00000057_g97.t1
MDSDAPDPTLSLILLRVTELEEASNAEKAEADALSATLHDLEEQVARAMCTLEDAQMERMRVDMEVLAQEMQRINAKRTVQAAQQETKLLRAEEERLAVAVGDARRRLEADRDMYAAEGARLAGHFSKVEAHYAGKPAVVERAALEAELRTARAQLESEFGEASGASRGEVDLAVEAENLEEYAAALRAENERLAGELAKAREAKEAAERERRGRVEAAAAELEALRAEVGALADTRALEAELTERRRGAEEAEAEAAELGRRLGLPPGERLPRSLPGG